MTINVGHSGCRRAFDTNRRTDDGTLGIADRSRHFLALLLYDRHAADGGTGLRHKAYTHASAEACKQ